MPIGWAGSKETVSQHSGNRNAGWPSKDSVRTRPSWEVKKEGCHCLCGMEDTVYNVYYWSHNWHKQLFSQMKTHWSNIFVFGSVSVFSDLCAVNYSQEIRSDLQTYCPVPENKKSQFCMVWNPLEFCSHAPSPQLELYKRETFNLMGFII